MNYSSSGLLESSFDCPNWKPEEIAEFQSILKLETEKDVTEEEARTSLTNLYQCFKVFVYSD
jgi:hypothetical protein